MVAFLSDSIGLTVSVVSSSISEAKHPALLSGVRTRVDSLAGSPGPAARSQSSWPVNWHNAMSGGEGPFGGMVDSLRYRCICAGESLLAF